MKRSLSAFLAVLMCILSISQPVYAATGKTLLSKDDQLKQSVNDVVYLLKEVFDSEYSRTEDEIKKLIKENGYDYTLSMQSFYDQPNPLKDADCIRYLAAYMSCKSYAKENSIQIPQFNQIPFIGYKTAEQIIYESVPTPIDDYIQDDAIEDEYIRVSNALYITEETLVPVYEQQPNGHYKKTDKTETITPKKNQITYITIELTVIEPTDIFEYFGIGEDLVSDDYERRAAMITKVTTNDAIIQSISFYLPRTLLDQISLLEYEPILKNLDPIRQTIAMTALSLQGKVPYEWGGKAAHPGFDLRWWSYNPDNGLQHGLDCSGFVQWVLMTSGFSKDIYTKVGSTKTILSSDLNRISKEELKPGDIGCTNRASGQINHCGIYVGNDMWIHCSSVKKTVTVSKAPFDTFFSVAGDAQIDENIVADYMSSFSVNIINSDNITLNIDTYKSIYYTHNYSEQDVTLLAKLIYNEARGEGINGWIAVGEVVVNRLNSDKFPNSISEVIYEPGQFSDNENLKTIEPSEEMMTVAQMVLSGNLRVLNNENILYFRNPKKTDDVPSTTPLDWGDHRWVTAINNHAFYEQ